MTEIREDYTEAEIARLAKNSKKERWAVTLVFEDNTLWTTKWYTTQKAAKAEANAQLLKLPIERVVSKVFLSNQADFNEEIATL